ncbi:MAG: hypothetical protein ABI720_08725 [Actinomycetes bacterium]
MRATWLDLGLLLLAGLILVADLVVVAVLGWSVDDLATLALPISFLAVGWLILHRYPAHTEGRLLLIIGLAWAVDAVRIEALSLPFDGGWVVPVGLMGTQLLLRYPDGRLPSRRWRWFAHWCTLMIVVLALVVTTGSRITAQGTSNPYFVPWAQGLSILGVVLPLSLLVSVGSVIVRYRRSSKLARAQIRWLAAAASVIVVLFCATLVVTITYGLRQNIDTTGSWFEAGYPVWLLTLQTAALLSFLLIPAAFGIAILRYHLYDIDRIIRRTTSYAIVTGLLLAMYALVVTTATKVLGPERPLVVAAATLTVAALARPVLRQVQAAVDRRFNRSRFDARHTADAFGKRIRNQVDPDHVSEDLVAVLNSTLQPESVALWIRKPT